MRKRTLSGAEYSRLYQQGLVDFAKFVEDSNWRAAAPDEIKQPEEFAAWYDGWDARKRIHEAHMEVSGAIRKRWSDD